MKIIKIWNRQKIEAVTHRSGGNLYRFKMIHILPSSKKKKIDK